MPPSTLRTFLALLISDSTRRLLSQLIADLSPQLPGLKWTKPDLLHLTLAFLGDVDSQLIPALITSASEPLRSLQPFDVHWQGLGAFPKPNRAAILWAGVSTGAQSLIDLQRPLASALTQSGFNVDSRFAPHITLARSKRFGGRPLDLRSLIDQHRTTSFGVDHISEIVLMKSDTLPTGSIYTPLATIPLGES